MKENNLLIITGIFPFDSNHAGIFIKEQIKYLRKDFNQIYVISPLAYFPKILLNSKRFQHFSNYSVYPTNYSFDNVKIFFPRYFPLSIFGDLDFLMNIRTNLSFLAVERTIEKEKLIFDIIHAHFTWPSGCIGVKLKERLNKPVIITIHENFEWFNKEVNMKNPLLNHALENADALIRVNKKDVPELKRFNKNVFSIPNGFPPRFKPLNKNECMEKLHLPMGKKSIFSLGWLIERKGFNYLINAMKIVNEKREVTCYIGGSGPLKNKLQKEINDLNLQANVKLIGHVPEELIPIWMNACDVFVLPSLAEGNPTVMFEALGCGKPFIGTKVSGETEIITSNDYGLLCEPANPRELAEKILIAVDKEWDSGKIIDYAKQFTWDKIAEQILEIYGEVLKEC